MAGSDYTKFPVSDGTLIWRYMDVERFTQLLDGHLYFAAATQFEDTFEGAITAEGAKSRVRHAKDVFPGDPTSQQWSIESTSSAFADLRRMTKINCWHAADHEDISMWERYGKGNPCVAVRSTVGALKQSLKPFRLAPNYGDEAIQIGGVQYIDYEADQMSDTSMLGIFLHKRIEFQSEKEIRALLSLRMASEFGVSIPKEGVIVDLDPDVLVDEVRCWPEATTAQVDKLSKTVAAAGLNASVESSTLSAPPTY